MQASIIASGVTYAYADGPPVLHGLSLHIARGLVTGIIGPNGSGKSTLLRLLAGVARPSGGHVTLGDAVGVRVAEENVMQPYAGKRARHQPAKNELSLLAPRARARRVAYLPQSVAPMFGLTVEDTVALGRYPHSQGFGGLSPRDHAAIDAAIERTGMAVLRKRTFTELSGGERQRALLASVLAQEPEFLLLDEPTAALDLHHESEVFALLKELAELGYGVCVVTHDLSLAAGHCDELLLLSSDGRAVARGLAPDVLTAEALTAAYSARVQVGLHPFTGAPLPYAPPGGGA